MSNRLNTISEKSKQFCYKVNKFIKDELNIDIQNKKLIIACSGGMDSMALLWVMYFMNNINNCKITVSYVNHNIRENSIDDWDIILKNTQSLILGVYDIYFKYNTIKLNNKENGIEEEARKLRYEILEENRQEFNADYILTGHHLNDLAEDQIMRQIRGCAWPGIGGMTGYCGNRKLLRPLLKFSKEEIKEFLIDIGSKWSEDETNTDLTYLRNRVRHVILPLFIKENPNYLKNAYNLWKMSQLEIKENMKYIDTVKQHIREDDECGGFRINKSVFYHNNVRSKKAIIIKYILDKLGPEQVRMDTIEQLTSKIERKDYTGMFKFGGHKIVCFDGQDIVFLKTC